MPLHGRKVIQLKWIANLIKCQRTQNIRKLKGGDNDSDAIDADVSFFEWQEEDTSGWGSQGSSL